MHVHNKDDSVNSLLRTIRTMSSKLIIWLCAFANCMQLSLQEWASNDTECTTPDKEVGDCVYYHHCKPLIRQIELQWKRQKVGTTKLHIPTRMFVCGYGKTLKVCCPRVKTDTNAGTFNVTSAPTLTRKPRNPVVNPGATRTPCHTGCLAPDNTIDNCVNIHDCSLDKNVCGVGNVTKESCPRLIPHVTPRPATHTNIPQITGRNLLPLDSCGSYNGDDRIFGGQMANFLEFPWMALLAYKTVSGTEFKCGGSLINDRYVLTTAHCLKNRELAYVRLGEYDLRNRTDCDKLGCAGPAEDIPVEDTIVHPEFESVYYHNDIGLIRLQNRIQMKEHIRPICLPIVPELSNEKFRKVTLTGWGLTGKSDNSGRSDVLMSVEVSVVGKTECRKKYFNGNDRVTDNKMCTSSPKGSCPGDSGGPVQLKQLHNSNVKYVQHGIISGGKCGGQRPGIHTRVDRYLDWIIDNIRP